MRPTRLFLALAFGLVPSMARAQGPFKADVLKEAPPAALSAAVRGELNSTGYRITNGKGKPFADIWLRKAIPASVKPAGANGTIQFPALTEGILLGALRYAGDGQDYRDQTIAPGVYTLRYGLQPQNGAHLGVSAFRDYALLLPSAKDTKVEPIAKKPLEETSAEAAGTSHPAVLMLLAAPEPLKAGEPGMVEDKEKNTWGVAIPLPLVVKGDAGPVSLDVQVIISGAAMP
jgi:hypothetical protein